MCYANTKVPEFVIQNVTAYFYRPKRSFGQGNIFRSVCHSVHRGGVPAPNFRGGCACSKFSGGACSNFLGGWLLQIFGGVPAPNFWGGLQFSEYGQCSAGTHPTGMHSCVQHISSQAVF